jgi:hypothetical protein
MKALSPLYVTFILLVLLETSHQRNMRWHFPLLLSLEIDKIIPMIERKTKLPFSYIGQNSLSLVRKTLFFFMLFIIAGNIYSQEIPPSIKRGMSIEEVKNALDVKQIKDSTVELGYGFSKNFFDGREEWKNQGMGGWNKSSSMTNTYFFLPLYDNDAPVYGFSFDSNDKLFVFTIEIVLSTNLSKNDIINRFNRKYGQFTRTEDRIVWSNNLPPNVEKILLSEKEKKIFLFYSLKELLFLELIPRVNFFIREDPNFTVNTREEATFLSPKNGTNFTEQEIYDSCKDIFNNIKLSERSSIALVRTICDFLNKKKPGVIAVGIQPDQGETIGFSIGRADMNKQ